MSEDATISPKKHALKGSQASSGYTKTEELNFEDFEELAKSVLRQRKISATVTNHLTPQFAEYDNHERSKQTGSAAQKPAKYQITSQDNKHASILVSIDSDLLDSIVIGIAQLVDNQRRFADEFGLNQEMVFSSDIKDIKNRGSTAVLHEWLRGGGQSASSKLDALLEDLIHHQENILTSLDTVSRRTIKYLSPELTEKSVRGLAKLGPMWPHYKMRNLKIAKDKRSRYKVIIAPGVAYGYKKSKKKNNKEIAKK